MLKPVLKSALPEKFKPGDILVLNDSELQSKYSRHREFITIGMSDYGPCVQVDMSANQKDKPVFLVVDCLQHNIDFIIYKLIHVKTGQVVCSSGQWLENWFHTVDV